MSIATRVAKNTSILVIGRIVNMGLVFATSIFVVRGLGAADYGQYTLIYSFPALFSWFAAFGTDNILVREVSQNPERAAELWANGLFLRLILSALAMIALFVTAISLSYDNLILNLLLLGGIEAIFLQQFQLPDLALRIELQQWRTVLVQTVHQLLWLALLLVLTALNLVSLQYLIIGRLVIVLGETFLLWWLARSFIRLRLTWSVSIIKGLLRASWPLALNALSIAIYSRVDRILIERFVNAEELGYYATASNLVGLMNIVPLAFVGSIYPLLCKRIDQEQNFDRVIAVSFRWLLISIIGSSGLLFLIGDWLITLIYGVQFAPAVPLFQILVWTCAFSTYGIVMANALMARNLHHYLTLATIASAVIALLGNLLALPIWGTVGSAWVSLLSYTVSGVLFFLLSPFTRHYVLIGLKKLIIIGIIAFVSIFIASAMPLPHTLNILIFLPLFVIGLFLLKVIGKEDVALLKQTGLL